MIEIIKEAPLLFECPFCYCVFKATKDEIQVFKERFLGDMNIVSVKCKCPTCGQWAGQKHKE